MRRSGAAYFQQWVLSCYGSGDWIPDGQVCQASVSAYHLTSPHLEYRPGTIWLVSQDSCLFYIASYQRTGLTGTGNTEGPEGKGNDLGSLGGQPHLTTYFNCSPTRYLVLCVFLAFLKLKALISIYFLTLKSSFKTNKQTKKQQRYLSWLILILKKLVQVPLGE